MRYRCRLETAIEQGDHVLATVHDLANDERLTIAARYSRRLQRRTLADPPRARHRHERLELSRPFPQHLRARARAVDAPLNGQGRADQFRRAERPLAQSRQPRRPRPLPLRHPWQGLLRRAGESRRRAAVQRGRRQAGAARDHIDKALDRAQRGGGALPVRADFPRRRRRAPQSSGRRARHEHRPRRRDRSRLEARGGA